jgi:Mn-dependent DtxR family transcriptional regulator
MGTWFGTPTKRDELTELREECRSLRKRLDIIERFLTDCGRNPLSEECETLDDALSDKISTSLDHFAESELADAVEEVLKNTPLTLVVGHV